MSVGACGDTGMAVHGRIAESCLALDEERFTEWLALCAREIRYSITAYSPEIRREMVWLDLDHAGIERIFGTLEHHERDDAALFRVPSVVRLQEREGRIHVLSSVLIARIQAAGTIQLYAAARYHDEWTAGDATPLLVSRRVHMHSRVLLSDSGGSHVIL